MAFDAKTVILYYTEMHLFLKLFAVVLITLAFVSPLASAAHSEGDHESDCAAECACLGCCAPAFAWLEQAGDLKPRHTEYASLPDMLFRGRLLLADIFRPPTAA